MNKRYFLISLLVLVAIAVFTTTAMAATAPVVVYDNNPDLLPGDMWSLGVEAHGLNELGDGVQLLTTSGDITQVSAIMVSWACQKLGTTGALKGLCNTAVGATFSQYITLNIYAVNDTVWPPTPGTLIL